MRERQSAFARRGGVASRANAGPGEVRIPSARCDMMMLMSRDRLSGFVRPAKRQGKVVRGLWELWVCLPPEPASGKDGLPLLDARGRPKMRYPKTMKVRGGPGEEGRGAPVRSPNL